MDEIRRRWLEAHPFLAPLAHVVEQVGKAADQGPYPAAPLPLDGFEGAHAAGLPLLQGEAGAGLRATLRAALPPVVGRIAAIPLPAKLAEGWRELAAELADPSRLDFAVSWLVANQPETGTPAQGSLLRFAGWQVLTRALAPHRAAWDAWRAARDAWRRPTCPTCGALPVMAQLVSQAAGRERQLACGGCATRWTWKRIGCPFCGCEANDRLAMLELEGPAGLRLDVCESCKGYLKVHAAEEDQPFFLSDWPTLVLDAMAAERGYVRRGASLYEL